MKKRGLRIVKAGMAILLSFLIFLFILINLPPVQSTLARKATIWLTQKTGDHISLKEISINPFTGIHLRHLALLDSTGTPMLVVNRMNARISFGQLLFGKYTFHRIFIDSADFRLIEHPKQDNYAFLQFIQKLSSGDTTPSQKPFVLKIRHATIQHLHFQLKDENQPPDDTTSHTINYSDIEMNHGEVSLRNFKITGDSITFHLDNLTAHEKSGLWIRKMRSHVTISGKVFSFDNTLLKTNHSVLQMDFAMLADGWEDYSAFIDSVKLVGNFKPSKLDMSDIGYFAGVMFRMKDRIHISGGHIEGPLTDLDGTNLDIRYGKSTRFRGDIAMRGLPEFYQTEIHARIKQFSTSVKDLKQFVLPQEDAHIPVPEEIDSAEKFHIKGTFDGSYYQFATNLSIQTSRGGNASLKVDLKADTARIHQMTAQLNGQHIPLQHFLGTQSLGNTDFRTSLHLSDSLGSPSIRLHFYAQKLEALNYPYHKIRYSGHFYKDTLQNTFSVTDTNFRFNTRGYTVFSGKPKFQYRFQLNHADFYALKLWEQKHFSLSGTGQVSFTGLQPDSLTGKLSMQNVIVKIGKDNYPVHHLTFTKKVNVLGQVMHFQSDLFDLLVTGKYHPATLFSSTEYLINHYFPVLPTPNPEGKTFSDQVRLTLLLRKPEFIGEHFIRGLNISPNTLFTAYINQKNKELTASCYAKKLIYNGIRSKYNHLEIRTYNNQLQTSFQIDHLILRDSTKEDKTVFGLDSLRLWLGARNDSLAYNLYWHNPDTNWINKGFVNGFFIDTRKFQKFNIDSSHIFVNDTLWKIKPGNQIIHGDSTWAFKNFTIYGGRSQFALQGKAPRNNGDTLNISFRSWNLSNLDLLWNMLGFDIDGIMNGSILFSRMDNRDTQVADLSIKNFAFNHTALGNGRILSTWNPSDNSAFIKAQVVQQQKTGREKIIDISGFYYPYRDTASLNLTMDFNKLKLKATNPFIKEYVSHLTGEADGQMTLKGSIKNPMLQGFINIKNTSLIINYLNTKYSFHQKIYFNKDKIDLGTLTLHDTLGNTAIVHGEIDHHFFRNMRLNFDINTKKLLFFNTTRHMNDVYYGTAIASGNIKITGPINDINMVINAKTTQGTSVVLPLDYSTEIADKDYIVFTPPPVDTLKNKPEETVLKIPEQQPSKYSIALNLDVQPSANLKIYLPSNMGDIQSNGSGILHMTVNSDGDMTLSGDYVVDKGEFNFSLGNLVKKHFELVKGGRISWAGDPYQATVYLKGLYKLKANLSTLGIVIDSTADYKNRTQVNCYIIMSHDLFNPDIRFQIHFPELDPDMQRLVYAQLDTTNTAVMNQQMISLLVLGAFSFSNAANISWNTSYYTILSNQLSSMLSKISKDFDIGINYKPGDALTKQEFDVALSTQLFDNRLIINGNFGMTYDKQNKSANNIVGDVDIKYKLTKDGRWMLKAYNHSNVNSWYYYSNYDKISPYTQGVGIVYRKEFNSLADLFRKRDRKKKAKKSSKKSKR